MEVTRTHDVAQHSSGGPRQPPRLALLVLAITTPRGLREYVAGDLHEEFVQRNRSRAWFWREVLRSSPCFIAAPRPALTAAIVAVSLIAGVHSFWTFVLSQIPLKADPVSVASVWRMFQ